MSEAQTVAIADFLLARIAEDARVAEAAEATEWFTTHNIQGRMVKQYGTLAAEFMVRYDPARALAECEAKRQIVEWMSDPVEYVVYSDDVLRALALPYADHPDYNPDWRP